MSVGNVTEAEWTGLVARFNVWFEGKRDPGIALKLGWVEGCIVYYDGASR